MKVFVLLISSLALLSGCVTTHQEQAATRGAVVGAAAGAVIAAPEGQAIEGAIVGGVIGASAGAILAGNSRSVYGSRRASSHRHHHNFDDDAYLRRYAYDD